MRICLDNFSNTRHMVLYYEDVIRDQDVGITKQMFSASDSAVVTLTAHFFLLPCAGIVSGAGVSWSSSEEAAQQACEDPYQTPSRPR
jgi:hypothetical protein